MSTQTAKFNDGGTTSNTIDRQFTPEFVSKMVVEMPARDTTFLDRANREIMPDNSGDTFTMEVSYPALHKDAILKEGIDANGALYLGNVWYAYNALGETIGTYSADDYMAVDPTMTYVNAVAAAKAAANATVGMVSIASGAGSIRNGQNSMLVDSGALASLPEEGGQMNEIFSMSKLVSAKVGNFGMNEKYTVKSVKLDSRVKLIGRTIKNIGRTRKEAQEGQARSSIVAAAMLNNMIASTTSTTIRQIDGKDRLTYEAFEAFEQDLRNNEVPTETTIVSGSTKVDTRVVEGGYVVYINKELVPTLRKIKGPDNTTVWMGTARYKDSVGSLIKGEVGAFEDLPFRFVVIDDMPIYKGQGSEVGADNTTFTGDAADVTEQGLAYKTNGYYDVFSLVVVGDDSYTTLSYGWGNVKAQHVKPQNLIGDGLDIYASKGAVITKWSYGCLVYRNERLRALSCSALKTGTAL